jgi:hypothetical protein
MTRDAVAEEWREQPVDPEFNQKIDDWERIRAHDAGAEKFLYLPGDEDLLRQEAFIVVRPDDICYLDNRR